MIFLVSWWPGLLNWDMLSWAFISQISEDNFWLSVPVLSDWFWERVKVRTVSERWIWATDHLTHSKFPPPPPKRKKINPNPSISLSVELGTHWLPAEPEVKNSWEIWTMFWSCWGNGFMWLDLDNKSIEKITDTWVCSGGSTTGTNTAIVYYCYDNTVV